MIGADVFVAAACTYALASRVWAALGTVPTDPEAAASKTEAREAEAAEAAPTWRRARPAHKAVLLPQKALRRPQRRPLSTPEGMRPAAASHPKSWTFELKRTTLAPYAEASVTVGRPDGSPTRRRVSACMN